MMEVIISINEEGKFIVKKTEGVENLFAVGMLELAKNVLLNPDSEFTELDSDEEVEVEAIEVNTDDVQ